MGQRSQIYIRYNYGRDYKTGEDFVKTDLKAIYFQWNFGERMVSRARGLIDWILAYAQWRDFAFDKLMKVASVNFDMRDVTDCSDIIAEYKEYGKEYSSSFNDFIFSEDNNDGRLLIDVTDDAKVKYAFLDYDNKYLGDANDYLSWDIGTRWNDPTNTKYDFEVFKYTMENLKFLKEKAILMTEEEAKEFLERDYSFLVQSETKE